MSDHERLPNPSINIGGLRGPDDLFHPVAYDLESILTERDPRDCYHIFALRYTDGTEAIADGALFEIEPGGHTPVMRITQAGYHTKRQVVAGEGVLLSMEPGGKVQMTNVSANEGAIFYQGEGCVDCWIAGPSGLKILDSSHPAFQLNFEEAVEVDYPSLPPSFWGLYHAVVSHLPAEIPGSEYPD